MKHRMKFLNVAVAMVVMGSVAPAFAGFEIVDEAPVASAPAAAGGKTIISSNESSLFGVDKDMASISHVVMVGKPDPNAMIVLPGQSDVASALRTLTPKGWSGYQRGNPDLTKIVKWNGDQDWAAAIGDALSTTNLMVEIDWNKQRIAIFPVPDKAFFSTGTSTKIVKKDDKADVVKAAPTYRWEIKPGETLRVAITRWMASIGWQTVWEVQNDFELKAGAVFTSDIETTLRKVAESVGVNISMFKGNKVTVVREGSN